MLICVTFSNLKNHQSHLDYEQEITNRAAEIVGQLLRYETTDPSISIDFWEQQYRFLHHEKQRIRKRRELLESIYDTLYEADLNMENRTADAHRIIQRSIT